MPNEIANISLAHMEQGGWGRLLRYSQSVAFVCAVAENFAPTYVSSNVIDLLGLAAAEVVAEPSSWSQRVHPEHRAIRRAGLHQAAAGNVHIGEYRFCRPDDTHIWLRETLSPDIDEDGIVRRVVGSVIDISAAREAQAKAADAEFDTVVPSKWPGFPRR